MAVFALVEARGRPLAPNARGRSNIADGDNDGVRVGSAVRRDGELQGDCRIPVGRNEPRGSGVGVYEIDVRAVGLLPAIRLGTCAT